MLLLIVETNRYFTFFDIVHSINKNAAIEYYSLLNLEAYALIISGLVQYLVGCNCNSTFEIIVLLSKILAKRLFRLISLSLRLIACAMYISLNFILLYIIFLNLSSLKVSMKNIHFETCFKTHYSKSCQLWICPLTFNILSFFFCCLNIKLLVICNMSLRNPGPNNNRPRYYIIMSRVS